VTLDELAARFRGPVQRDRLGLHAFCPAHEDGAKSGRPSLRLWANPRTRWLNVKCWAGCSAQEVLRMVGMTPEELRPERRDTGTVVAEYEYRDESGALLSVVERRAPKAFRQRRPDPARPGEWVWNLAGVRRVLYRLPELHGSGLAVIAEGEGCVETLCGLGLTATCNPGGAGKWRDEYARQLVAAGVEAVVILPDHDEPGEAHAAEVARSCRAAGLRVSVLRLPGLPPKGDVTDWCAAGHTREELETLMQAALTEPAPAGANADGLALTSMAELLAEPEEAHAWLVDGRLPVGGLGLLAGKPKAGKSTLARCLALAVARGDPWLGFATIPGPVIYLGFEEKRGEVRRHFRAMGARPDDPLFVLIGRAPEEALVRLAETVKRVRPVLVIVDTVARLLPSVREWNDYGPVTAALEPVLALARETGAHVLLVHHMGKGERAGGDAVLGSTAIFAAADTTVLLKRLEHYRTLSTIQRYGDDLEELTVTLDPETRAVAAGVLRREAEEEEAAGSILAYLAVQSEPLDEATILDNVEGRRGLKVKGLRRLVGQGQVTRTGAGKKGDVYRYAVLVPLFPTSTREQENKKQETVGSGEDQMQVSCPGDSGPSGALSEAREQETEAHSEACDCRVCVPPEVIPWPAS